MHAAKLSRKLNYDSNYHSNTMHKISLNEHLSKIDFRNKNDKQTQTHLTLLLSTEIIIDLRSSELFFRLEFYFENA